MPNLTIVMPVFNEYDSLIAILPRWIKDCQKYGWSLIVVNDGSTDKTCEILRSHEKSTNLVTFYHKVNRGYGGALKTGILNAQTKYVVTVDADGQHSFESVENLYKKIVDDDSDLVIGSRPHTSLFSFRGFGKFLIRTISRFLIPNSISDLNSGMKIYQTELAKKYLKVCPNSMAFSDIIALTFLAERCKVTEYPILVKQRVAGKSKIKLSSAIDTVIELINIIVFFNPLRIFLPVSFFFLLLGLGWSIPIVVQGRGVSVGSLLGITLSSIFFVIGLVAEQLSQIRKMLIEK